MNVTSVDVCIVGGGPAGLTLALALARRGRRVVVLEKAPHFQRSFRGESISPDGVWLLDRLGLLEEITAIGALVTRRLEMTEGGRTAMRVDFDVFPYACPYPMEIPQPTLLRVLAGAAAQHGGFELRQPANVTRLVEEGGVVRGVCYLGPEGPQEVRAELTVGADGRFSKVLAMSGLQHRMLPLARDVVWLRLPCPVEWAGSYRIALNGSRHAVFVPTYPDSVRVGFNIPKGGLKDLRRQGIGALHARLDELAPELSAPLRTHISGWKDTSMLDIFTTVVPQWSRPGLVLVGDAAHTLTPILGQGVNHALIDGVTLAKLVDGALGTSQPMAAALREFQRIRQGDVAKARRLQLRQEWMFTFDAPPAVLLRTSIYRAMHRSRLLQRRILGDAYFRLQPPLGRAASTVPAA
ncbi:MAG TPA: FAD-dependent oxidoreductase [Pseudonocardiaceae bacterium]